MPASPLLKRLRFPAAPADEPALIGVSGGRDSVALLDLLASAGRKLVICHLDHGLRSESKADAQFVQSLANRYGLPFVTNCVNVRALAKRGRKSLETAARDARYAFFARAAHDADTRRIYLAHHADDQVETFLFNLFRGAGPTGLRGMRFASQRRIGGIDLEIVRPLLSIWREEIDAYIETRRLDFREDHSNTDPQHTRNRLRHQVIPMIEAGFGREVRKAIWRAAEILAEEGQVVSAALTDHALKGPDIAVSGILPLPVALQRRLLHAWLLDRGIASVGYEEVEKVRALIGRGSPAKVNLPGGHHARRRAGRIFIERGTSDK